MKKKENLEKELTKVLNEMDDLEWEIEDIRREQAKLSARRDEILKKLLKKKYIGEGD